MGRPSFVRTISVYGIFTASGASALIYQVIWSRWLSLVFGSTTASVSIVLGCFMTGLALGSWGAGRYVARIANPMRVYAAIELGIGVFALVSPFVFRLPDAVFPLLVRPDSPVVLGLSLKAVIAFAVLSVPTTLMGATLPLLTEFFRRNPRHTENWKVGMLYAANTMGAAIGVLAAGFVLIELFGVAATTTIAASLNLVVAGLGYRFSMAGGITGPGEAPVSGERKLDWTGRLAVAVLAAGGAAALASEVLWTRSLETLLGNSTYAFATIVLVYLVGIAAGSWIMALAVHRVRRHAVWLAGLQLFMGIGVLVAIGLFEAMADGISAYSGRLISIPLILWIYMKAICIVLPLAILSGACFPLATRMIAPEADDPSGDSIAVAYAWNTAGAVAGSIVAGFVIAPNFEFLDSLHVLALMYGAIALAALLAVAWRERQARGMRRLALPLGALSLALVAFAAYGTTKQSYFVQSLLRKERLSVVTFHRPGLQGVTTVYKHPALGPRYDGLLVNGIGMTVKVTDTKMMAHLPMVLHGNPRDTLVICLGMGTTFRSAMSHGGNVTTVELVKEVCEAFDQYYDDAATIKASPRARMIVNDGRNFLKLTREKFDVITIDPPPPIDAAGVVHLYSKEFIELAKAHLRKGGVMAHWYPYPGSGSGVEDRKTWVALVTTFAKVFPYTYFMRGYSNVGIHVVGAMEPLSVDGGRIEKSLSAGAGADLREWDPVPSSYFMGVSRVIMGEPEKRARVLTDDDPFLEFYLVDTLVNGEKKMFPNIMW